MANRSISFKLKCLSPLLCSNWAVEILNVGIVEWLVIEVYFSMICFPDFHRNGIPMNDFVVKITFIAGKCRSCSPEAKDRVLDNGFAGSNTVKEIDMMLQVSVVVIRLSV